MIFHLLLGILAITLAPAKADSSWGKCTDMKLTPDFELGRYSGLWYEQMRDRGFTYEKGDCQQARYSLVEGTSKNDTVYVLNSQFRNDETGFDTIAGVAKCKGAHCTVKFRWYLPGGDYRVLDTDYKSYAVVYACKDVFGIAKIEYVWVLTRDMEVDSKIMNRAMTVISDRLPWYNLNNLYDTKQGGKCRYLPVDEFLQQMSPLEDGFMV